jgi:hypothetical protein
LNEDKWMVPTCLGKHRQSHIIRHTYTHQSRICSKDAVAFHCHVLSCHC